MKAAKTAWLIYWEVMGDHYDVKDGEVVTVLSSRLGEEKVQAALELLYKQFSYDLEERMIHRQVGSGPYKVMNPLRAHGVPVAGLQYSIGNNPMLTARKVKNLKTKDGVMSWQVESVAHPEWLCDHRHESDCPLRGKPSVMTSHSYAIPE